MKLNYQRRKQNANLIRLNIGKFAMVQVLQYSNQILFLRLKSEHVTEANKGNMYWIKIVTDKNELKELLELEVKKGMKVEEVTE